jgi:hypothetical protein
LAVPDVLLRLVASPRWTEYLGEPRHDPRLIESVFGEAPDPSWKFYTRNEIEGMTKDWHNERDPLWFGRPPDDIVATRSVLIGELGYDRMFALDYRSDEPSVRFMTADGRWVHVADSVADLLARLGITVEPT